MNRLQCSYPVSRTQFGQRSQVPGGLTCQLHEDVKMSSEWLESRHHGRSAYVPVRLKKHEQRRNLVLPQPSGLSLNWHIWGRYGKVMNPAKKLMLALTLSTAMLVPTAGAFGNHTNAPHRNFAQRHPVITTIAGAVVVHHFLKRRH